VVDNLPIGYRLTIKGVAPRSVIERKQLKVELKMIKKKAKPNKSCDGY
jgi:hypothetical protein